jgi:hypothetical protein
LPVTLRPQRSFQVHVSLPSSNEQAARFASRHKQRVETRLSDLKLVYTAPTGLGRRYIVYMQRRTGEMEARHDRSAVVPLPSSILYSPPPRPTSLHLLRKSSWRPTRPLLPLSHSFKAHSFHTKSLGFNHDQALPSFHGPGRHLTPFHGSGIYRDSASPHRTCHG